MDGVFEVLVRAAVTCGGGGIWVACTQVASSDSQPQIELQFRMTACGRRAQISR